MHANGNLQIWDDLRRPDPAHTKPFTRSGGFKGLAIDPMHTFHRMTERFGACGVGWRINEPDFKFVSSPDGQVVVFCTVSIEYAAKGADDGSERSSKVFGVGGDVAVRKNKEGNISVDDEAAKKAFTDAITNAMKYIGMNADVHMGLYDDSKYRNEAAAYYAAKEDPQLRPEATVRFEAEVKKCLLEVSDLDGLDELWRSGVSARVRDIGLVDKAAQQRIVGHFSARKAELQRDAPDDEPEPPTRAPEGTAQQRSAPPATRQRDGTGSRPKASQGGSNGHPDDAAGKTAIPPPVDLRGRSDRLYSALASATDWEVAENIWQRGAELMAELDEHEPATADELRTLCDDKRRVLGGGKLGAAPAGRAEAPA